MSVITNICKLFSKQTKVITAIAFLQNLSIDDNIQRNIKVCGQRSCTKKGKENGKSNLSETT